MSLSSRSRFRAFAVSTLALGVLLGSAATASATGEDDRATRHEGNVDAGQKGACATAGFGGEPIADGQIEFTGGTEEDRHLTITEVAEGIEVTGIVVKGGNAHNVYVPGERGLPETPPWNDLRSPLNKGGNIPQISHWFACGTETVPTTTTTTTESDEPTESTEPSEPSSSTTEPSAPSSQPTSGTEAPTSTSTVAPGTSTTSTDVAVAPASDDDDLASTGFGGGWLIGLGGLLLIGGGALLALARVRRKTT